MNYRTSRFHLVKVVLMFELKTTAKSEPPQFSHLNQLKLGFLKHPFLTSLGYPNK